MPELDGLEVLRRLRDEADCTAVVLLSTFDDPELHDAARGAGAAAYLTKDPDRLELIARLDAVVTIAGRPPRYTSDNASPALQFVLGAWNLFCGRPMGDGGRGAGRTTRRLVAGPESGTGGHRDQ
jgi:DNA-binding response OmpR family regulator